MKQTILSFARSHHAQLVAAAVLSAAGGGYGGYKLAQNRLRTHYEEIANKEIQEAKEFYGRLYKNDEEHSSPGKVWETLHGKEAVEALKSYQGVNVEAPAATEADLIVNNSVAPLEGEEENAPVTIVNNIFVTRDREFDYETEVANRTEDSPYIITEEEYLQNESEYEQASLTYFEDDGVLVDDEDAPIPDSHATVNDDNLVRFGHGANSENVVFVRNDRLEMEFEIERSFGSYVKEVLGFDEDSLEHSDRRGVRKFRDRDD